MPRVPRGLGNLMKWSREVNQCLQQLRDRVVVTRGGGGGGVGGVTGPCAFGEINTNTEDPPVTSIRGGIIHCGDQNWNMDPQTVNLATPGTWLVSIAVSCISNRDDDDEILLPGIETGTRPTGSWTNTAWTTGTDYPDNTAPTLPTGAGTIILPIGKLTIADGVATLAPSGCGNFRIGQCAGALTYARE